MSKGKTDKATKVLQHIAEINSQILPEDIEQQLESIHQVSYHAYVTSSSQCHFGFILQNHTLVLNIEYDTVIHFQKCH